MLAAAAAEQAQKGIGNMNTLLEKLDGQLDEEDQEGEEEEEGGEEGVKKTKDTEEHNNAEEPEENEVQKETVTSSEVEVESTNDDVVDHHNIIAENNDNEAVDTDENNDKDNKSLDNDRKNESVDYEDAENFFTPMKEGPIKQVQSHQTPKSITTNNTSNTSKTVKKSMIDNKNKSIEFTPQMSPIQEREPFSNVSNISRSSKSSTREATLEVRTVLLHHIYCIYIQKYSRVYKYYYGMN